MKKITRKELCELCLEKMLISEESTEPEFLVQGSDSCNQDCVRDYTDEIIAVVEALGVEVVDGKEV